MTKVWFTRPSGHCGHGGHGARGGHGGGGRCGGSARGGGSAHSGGCRGGGFDTKKVKSCKKIVPTFRTHRMN